MSVSVVGVVGAGFMGSGIAESAARAGKQVIVYESQQAPLERSRERIAASVSKAVARGKFSQEDAAALTDRVIHTTRLEDLCGADAVIEAVFEDRRVKGDLFALMDETFPDALFLASNTSSIAIAELAARTERPERVVGMHFFSPVPVIQLVELVAGIDTANETVAAAEVFVQEIGKHAIHTKDRSGFIVNVLLFPYLMSAVRLYEDGFASREPRGHRRGDEARLRASDGGAGAVRFHRPGCNGRYLRVALYGVQTARVRAAAAAQADGHLRPPRPQDRPRFLRLHRLSDDGDARSSLVSPTPSPQLDADQTLAVGLFA